MGYKKTAQKAWKWILALVMTIIGIAIGGLFIGGLTVDNIVLKYIPAVVHYYLGWAIVIGSIIAFLYKIYKAVK